MNQLCHQPEILRVTPFIAEGGAVAAITLGYGPIIIHAKLFRSKDGGYFLSMPARKSQDEKYYNQCDVEDRSLLKLYETMAIEKYEATMLSRVA